MAIVGILAGCQTSSLVGKTRTPGDDTATEADADTDADADADTDADTDADSDADADADTDPGDPYDPVPSQPTLSTAALVDIADDIDAILASTVARSGVYVVDATTGQIVYENDPDGSYKPASNTKLFTTGAALSLLGEDYELWLEASSGAAISGGHVADLYVVSNHDYSWPDGWYHHSSTFAADRLADDLYLLGLRSVGTLHFRGEVLVDASSTDYYDAAEERGYGMGVMESALEGRGITVSTSTNSSSFTGGLVPLAERTSPPMHVLEYWINVVSHNEMADMQARHNGMVLAGGSTYADGETVVKDWLSDIGVSSSALQLYDGSGLSHSNRISPRLMVDMQQAMLDHPAGEAWLRTFSIAGVIGTLSGRMTGADTWGRFYGKSGTLNGVITTSGTLFHVHDGHRYLISALMNDVVSWDYARDLENQIVEVIARDNRNLGNRPSQPVLEAVLDNGDGTLDIQWTAPGADGSIVWLTTDGMWRESDARYVTGTQFRAGNLQPDTTYGVRITTVNAAGQSDPSDEYASRTGSGASILVVDGTDRLEYQEDNARGFGHPLARFAGEAAAPRSVDTVDDDVVGITVQLSDYDAVIWVAAEESTVDDSFDATQQNQVTTYLQGGGKMLITGSEIGWDLVELGSSTDQTFYTSMLKAAYLGDDAGTYVVRPSGTLFAGMDDIEFYTPAVLDAAFPDRLATTGGSVAELSYEGGTGGVAAVSYDGAYQLVYLGFPLETVDDPLQRAEMMDRVLDWFGL